ncbi:MAG: PKD domain-containing protein, partial [Thermoplasmata archaeon]|nr:PKD domain-containing protein [Thermoplasmata archaeon]
FGDETDLVVGENPTHAYTEVGVYTFTVYVDDGRGENVSESAVATITSSEAPVADAGSDQTVDEGDEVTFDGSASTDDVDIVNYTWTFDYDGEEEELYGEAPVFQFDIAGEYTATLTVRDAEDKNSTDTVTIAVQGSDSWISQYGLAIGALLAVAIVAAAVFVILKARKGGKGPTDMGAEGLTAGEPEPPAEPGPPPES